jgi:DNA polymerase-3 subunit alpha (Gram-positive type)
VLRQAGHAGIIFYVLQGVVLKQGEFFSALRDSVQIDEGLALRFIKIQHDTKTQAYLARFESAPLPPQVYLEIERFVCGTLGGNALPVIAYNQQFSPEEMAEHARALLCAKDRALAPFLQRAEVRAEGGSLHIDFSDAFGKELFAKSGLADYIGAYMRNSFGAELAVRIGTGAKKAPKRAAVKAQISPEAPAAKAAAADAPPWEEPAPEKKPAENKQPEKKAAAKKPSDKKTSGGKQKQPGVIHGRKLECELLSVCDISETTGLCAVAGSVVDVKTFDIKNETRGKKSIVVFGVTDLSSTITCKAFVPREQCEEIRQRLTSAPAVRVTGTAGYDTYSRELVITVKCIEETKAAGRCDEAEVKRVELHLHTNMSALDAVVDEADVVKRAAEFGHEAVAITDHGVVQAFPRAFDAARQCGVKVIYGMEAYMIDDTGEAYREEFADEYVVFDLETTGLNPKKCGITEIGAVRLKHGEITDTFCTFVNPGQPISAEITAKTGITNEMVKGAPDMGEALGMFKAFAGDTHLAAHNAAFDLSFIYTHGDDYGIRFDNPCLDTLWLFKRTLPGHRSYSLGKFAADLGIEFRHHRALDDAEATAKLMKICMDAAKGTPETMPSVDEKTLPVFHIILLCKNSAGLRNLYELVSDSHMNHYYRRPRVTRSQLISRREGLLLGSACEQGELIQAILRYASDGELKHIAQFYDYLEVQPDGNNMFMVREGRLRSVEEVRDITRRIVTLGEDTAKPVAATCDAHFLEPQDEYFRRILMYGQGFTDADNQAPLFYRTTAEMLAEFKYLGEEKAKAVVIEVPRTIAAQIENIRLLPDDTAMPTIDKSAEKLEDMCWANAKQIYGDPLPEIVEQRLKYELDAIIKHGYDMLYYIAYELVSHSLRDGYLVGSRGSVGSSLAATMAGITEVNGLQPHYVCPNCRHSDFDVDTEAFATGPDLPAKDCPVCGTPCRREGYGIPFAVFLGIDADKVPDIDLNFSGEYQPKAHQFILDYFGRDHVFRAGTISSVKDQTAYGYVKNYLQDKGLVASRAEVDRLVKGISGTKRTTGQHPGVLVILPGERDIHEFTPIQYPANDTGADSVTTHYNFNSLHDRLIKLDILGHDDPTALHMLQELTGIDPKSIPINDADTLSLFSSLKALHLSPDQILGCEVGSLGIPEFGTKFVRQILVETRPTTIGELVRIAGLSHGTDVWLNNAHDLIQSGTANLRQVICTRDDIMNYLVSKGMDLTLSFYIMESVRKGKGLKKDWEKAMREADVPEWFIDSCKKIKYMFPRAHSVAYVMMSLRIAFFKVHDPQAFYATYFSVRADNLDAQYLHSAETVRMRLAAIEAKGKAATALEESQATILEVALEMIERGIDFLPCDLYKSDATRCLIEEHGLRLPFTALGGTGGAAAKGIVQARQQGEFVSVEDLKKRSGISSAVIAKLEEYGCLNGMVKSSQLSLFD